ncbi:MAG: hypothetical protein ACYDC7_01435 [Acidithiobacillus ferrivorans]
MQMTFCRVVESVQANIIQRMGARWQQPMLNSGSRQMVLTSAVSSVAWSLIDRGQYGKTIIKCLSNMDITHCARGLFFLEMAKCAADFIIILWG